MRWFLIALLVALVGCGGGEAEERAALRREVEELRKEKAHKEARVEALKEHFGELVFETSIPRTVKLEEANNRLKTISMGF